MLAILRVVLIEERMALNFQATPALVEIICGKDDVNFQTWFPQVYRFARIVENEKLARI